MALAEKDKDAAIALTKSQLSAELQDKTASKDLEIQELKNKVEGAALEQKLAVKEALAALESQYNELKKKKKTRRFKPCRAALRHKR